MFGFKHSKAIYYLFNFILTLDCATGWKRYEEPLKISEPNKDGVYEFELVMEHKLTMSRPQFHLGTNFHKFTVLDYEPNVGSWIEREGNQSLPCDAQSVLIQQNETEEKMNMMLKGVIQHNGLHVRIIAINGNSPGEVIVVPHNAEVVMRVRNRLNTESLTIHIHGLDKRGLWYTDGVAFIQQCPISVGSDYVYRFLADTPGTHWYHGHLNTDRGDGVLGGFVVKSPNETFPTLDGWRVSVEREYYLLLQDWSVPSASEQWYNLHEGTMKWVEGFDHQDKERCWAPTRTYDGSNVGGSVPLSAILVGNKGWYEQVDLKTRPSKLPLATYRIKKGENVVFRLVNGGVSQELMVWLEGHDIVVIAADGVEVKPRKVDSIVIFSGERYDILVQGLKTPKQKTYRFIFETMERFHWNWTHYEPFIGLANVEYEDVNLPETENVDFSHKRCTKTQKCLVLNCPFEVFPSSFNYDCIPSSKLQNSELIDSEIIGQREFTENFEEYFVNMHFDSHVNGWMFRKPLGMPYYHEGRENQITEFCDPSKCNRYSGSKYDHSCDCFIHFNFTLGSVVQMTIYNMGDGGTRGTGYSHPFHLHGTHFYVMKHGFPSYDVHDGTIKNMNPNLPCDVKKRCLDITWANASWLNGNIDGMEENPSFRDTVLVPTGGYVVIRFRASNPGWWFAHCHLMLHHMQGTAFAFRIGAHEQIPRPPDGFPHDCGIYEPPKLSNNRESEIRELIFIQYIDENQNELFKLYLFGVCIIISCMCYMLFRHVQRISQLSNVKFQKFNNK